MLSIRDPTQNTRSTYTKSEDMVEKYSKQTNTKKKAGVAILISDKMDFKSKAIERYKKNTS